MVTGFSVIPSLPAKTLRYPRSSMIERADCADELYAGSSHSSTPKQRSATSFW